MASVLSNLRCFRSLSSDVCDDIASQAKQQDLPAGSTIINESDREIDCFVVLDGRLAVSKSSLGGHELTVDLLYTGDFFGLGMALGWEVSPVRISAQVKSSIIWIPRDLIAVSFRTNFRFAQELLRDVFNRLDRSYESSKSLAHDNAISKVAHSLLVLAQQFEQSNCGCGYLSVCMTREQIADFIGCARETVTRVVQDLSKDKIVDLSTRGKIKIIDINALRLMSGWDIEFSRNADPKLNLNN